MSATPAKRPLHIRIEGANLPGRTEPDLIGAAAAPGHHLVARLSLTDAKGGPRCASLRPPALTWTVLRR